jgi:hypothetical protein
MFRRNSFFSSTESETEHLKGVRQRALDVQPTPVTRREAETHVPYSDGVLEDVESALARKDHSDALRLLREARDELDRERNSGA